ncbi:MAG: hypothetical protein U0V75_03655 [Ferruginibacter sp.]
MKKIILLHALTAISATLSAQSVISTAPVKQAGNIAAVLSTKKMTAFKPELHGFKFANTFTSAADLGGINGLRLGGLCGGMVYSSLDYFNRRVTIPSQSFRPANRTTLQSYIYNRQLNSLVGNADKWTELILNPFGSRTAEFFNWGLQGNNGGRIQELKESIDKGNPAPLGLFIAGDGGFRAHHQVLAIGYDMGRYKGDLGEYKEDFKIFIYDPNYPNSTMTLKADPAHTTYYYEEDKSKKWMTYFVDKKYAAANPPVIQQTVLPNDGLVRELLVEIATGGDDLRGGNDNAGITVNYTDGSSETYPNINKGARWIDNYCETVVITLKKPAAVNQLKSIVLKTSFGGGIGGDNWNVDGIYIVARSGNSETSLYSQRGTPLVRFDGNNKPLTISFR